MSAVYELPVQASFEQTLLAGHPLAESRVSELEVHRSTVNQTNLEIELLLASIESPALREAMQPVFGDLLRLLDCLQLFQGLLSQTDQAHDTLAMFDLVQIDARSIMNHIRNLTMQTSGIDESLTETLDGIAFAIGHDLHRVFDCQLSGETRRAPAEQVIGELTEAHGVVKNCVQQSIITLAQQFDPAMVGGRLFEDANARLTESLTLCNDLNELIQVVRALEETQDELPTASLVEHVVNFRRGSMRLLLYRDWQEYEVFSARITLASTDRQTLGPVLNSFACYLETLLRQVSSRAVLSSVSDQPLPSEHECMLMEQ